jgi:bifunctional non-homologous end joining protein LigD
MPRRTAPVSLPVLPPMLATPGGMPRTAGEWAFEVKWDGHRVMSYLDGAGGLRVLSRNGHDITDRLPELAELLDLLPHRSAVLDGEVVVLDEHGRPDFGRLQERMAPRRPGKPIRPGKAVSPVTLMVFDVLLLDGDPTVGMSYRGRREVLETLSLDGERVVCPPVWPGSASREAVAWTRAQGLEGVIAKRLSSTYAPGSRTPDWIKIKHTRSVDVRIGGWVPTGTTVKSLLLGVPDGGGLRYVGKVGTGFGEAERKVLAGLLERFAVDASPFTSGVGPDRVDPIRWVRPELAAEVEYLSYTTAGLLRQPIWKGLRGNHGD